MNIVFLADISDVMQSSHPVFGVPIGVCLLLFVLFKVFSSNQTPPKNDSSSTFQLPNIPTKDTTPFGEHLFNKNGFCLKCGYERDFLINIQRPECELNTTDQNYNKPDRPFPPIFPQTPEVKSPKAKRKD
jgi:hypothetical protein